jgi:hypothetical protein
VYSLLEENTMPPNNHDNCSLCAIPSEERQKVEQALVSGDALRENVAELYHTDVAAVEKHMAEHRVLPEEYAEKRRWLYGKAIQLSQLIDRLIEDMEYRPTEVKALVSAMAELRQEIRTLAEIEGELQRKPNITIHQYNSLKMIVFSSLCADCQKRVVEQLKRIETT